MINAFCSATEGGILQVKTTILQKWFL